MKRFKIRKATIIGRLFPFVLFLFCFSLRGEFYRYLDLTPVMNVLPRGSISEDIASYMRCFQVTGTPDSMVVRGIERGEPFQVFDLSSEIFILDEDSMEYWQLEGFGYVIEKDASGRPLLLTRRDPAGEVSAGADGTAFVEFHWNSDTVVTVFPLNSRMGKKLFKVHPVYRGTAARLDDQGNLVYFKYQSVAAMGFQYVLDSSGRPLSRIAVDEAGNEVVTAEGILATRYTYDSSGNTTGTAYHDSLGALLPMEYQLSQDGNWGFDENGTVLNGYRIAFVRREFDGNGLYVSETNIGVCGEPVPDDQGRVATLYEREIHGGITCSRWYGSHGEPVEIAGVWATRRTYDQYGRVIESSTWDSQGQLAEFPGGFASTRFSYTPSGSVEMISYFDLHGNPVVNTVQGCHARSHYYDLEGNLEEIQYLDTGYRLMNNSAGYARTVFSYVGSGIQETHYDLNGTML